MSENGTKVVIGVDLGDKHSQLFVIHRDTGEVEERRIVTSVEAFRRTFGEYKSARVALEVGTHSPWAARSLAKLGHEVIVANPRMLGLIHGATNKNDRSDAEKLALLADYNPELLSPVEHRSAEAQTDMAVVRARDTLVRTRTVLINHVRGAVKSVGGRLSKCDSRNFVAHARANLPDPLRPALEPMLGEIETKTATIHGYDKLIEALNQKYLATARLRQIAGVGPITALVFVLVIANPLRFHRSRDVGAYAGLVRRRFQTGSSDPELRITKAGDRLLRRLLVQSAQYILGPFGPECDLRSWGLGLVARGRKNAKKRAVVAVARKLAVLLHRLWVTGETYDPLRNTRLQGAKRAARQPTAAAGRETAAAPS
jgi:transposase